LITAITSNDKVCKQSANLWEVAAFITRLSEAMSSITDLSEKLCDLFTISNDQESIIHSRVPLSSESSKAGENRTLETVNVGVTNAVSTFVAQKSFSNFTVPHFACHWGVVCDFEDIKERVLFHLLYDTKKHKVIFDRVFWRNDWNDTHEIKHVGTTTYKLHHIKEIGIHFSDLLSC